MTSPGGAGQHWEELSAVEVLAALHRLTETGLPAVSGFLDIHQWLPLQSRPEIQLAGGHPSAQFRRAGLATAPAVTLWGLETSALPSDQRSARSLRRRLMSRSGHLPDIGDLQLGEGQAIFAAAETWTAQDSREVMPCAAWPDPPGPPNSTSLASLRLDAFVAAAFRASRAEAATAIGNGYVFLNFSGAAKASRQVGPGDQVVLRGKGRAELLTAQVNQRSGRTKVEYRTFPC
jgi:ribosomal 50S subunit-recycling heat shock protein